MNRRSFMSSALVALIFPREAAAVNINISIPGDGSALRGVVPVTVSCSPVNKNLQKVRLLLGSQLLHEAPAPFTFNWDTTTTSNGAKVLNSEAVYKSRVSTASLQVVVANDVAPPPPPPTNWQPPLVITAGGTYEGGNYESSGSGWENGAVVVQTIQPVTLRGMNLRNLFGGSVVVAYDDSRVTVENCTLTGGSTVSTSGRAFTGWQQHSVTIRNCSIRYTRGIELSLGNPAGQILITRNRHEDIAGGDINLPDVPVGNFVQLRHAAAVSIEISWNEIRTHYINEHQTDNSLMAEDLVSIYNTSNARVFDNMFWHQSYPGNLDGSHIPGRAQYSSQGGITVDSSSDGPGCHNNYVARNQVVDGYGIVASVEAGGNGNLFESNRIVQDGYLDNGEKTRNGWSSPLVILPGGANNHAHGNYIAYIDRGGTHPLDPWDAEYATHAAYALRGALEGGNAEAANNTFKPRPIAKGDEDAEWTLWQQKLAANGITVGSNL